MKRRVGGVSSEAFDLVMGCHVRSVERSTEDGRTLGEDLLSGCAFMGSSGHCYSAGVPVAGSSRGRLGFESLDRKLSSNVIISIGRSDLT